MENRDLETILVEPIQRLPRYDLIFRDLKKKTETQHPDYENIVKAYEIC